MKTSDGMRCMDSQGWSGFGQACWTDPHNIQSLSAVSLADLEISACLVKELICRVAVINHSSIKQLGIDSGGLRTTMADQHLNDHDVGPLFQKLRVATLTAGPRGAVICKKVKVMTSRRFRSANLLGRQMAAARSRKEGPRSSNPLPPPRPINILQRNHLYLPPLLQGGDAFHGGAGAGQGGDGGDGVIEGGAA